MLEKVIGMKIELKTKTPKQGEEICNVCGGTGWMYNKEYGTIIKCKDCYDGVITVCEKCGKPTRGSCNSYNCVIDRAKKREEERLSKAIKANYEDVPAEHKEMMYHELFPNNYGYFSDFEEFVEYCEGEGIELPAYVWSTEKTKLTIDADSIVSNACDELHEDAYDNIGEADIKELQELLNNWCSKQTGTDTYSVDYRYAITLKR